MFRFPFIQTPNGFVIVRIHLPFKAFALASVNYSPQDDFLKVFLRAVITDGDKISSLTAQCLQILGFGVIHLRIILKESREFRRVRLV